MDEIEKLPWPRRGDKLFVRGAQDEVQAYIHHCGPTVDAVISDAYKESADLIINAIEKGDILGHADRFFFPVAYLYRHTLELQLKNIIRMGVTLGLLKDDNKLRETLSAHCLYPLWNKAVIVVKGVWPGGDANVLKAAEDIISQFHNLDPSGQELRYSSNKYGKPSLKDAPKIIDMSNLKRCFAGIYEFLSSCEGGIGEAVDCVLQSERDNLY